MTAKEKQAKLKVMRSRITSPGFCNSSKNKQVIEALLGYMDVAMTVTFEPKKEEKKSTKK